MRMTKEVEKLALYGVLIGGGLALLYVAQRGIGGTARDVTAGILGGVFDAAGGVITGAYEAIPQPIKPSSDKNIVYQGANKIVQALPGSSNDETLGTWLYSITHPNERF